jgi:hypothetical protein
MSIPILMCLGAFGLVAYWVFNVGYLLIDSCPVIDLINIVELTIAHETSGLSYHARKLRASSIALSFGANASATAIISAQLWYVESRCGLRESLTLVSCPRFHRKSNIMPWLPGQKILSIMIELGVFYCILQVIPTYLFSLADNQTHMQLIVSLFFLRFYYGNPSDPFNKAAIYYVFKYFYISISVSFIAKGSYLLGLIKLQVHVSHTYQCYRSAILAARGGHLYRALGLWGQEWYEGTTRTGYPQTSH